MGASFGSNLAHPDHGVHKIILKGGAENGGEGAKVGVHDGPGRCIVVQARVGGEHGEAISYVLENVDVEAMLAAAVDGQPGVDVAVGRTLGLQLRQQRRADVRVGSAAAGGEVVEPFCHEEARRCSDRVRGWLHRTQSIHQLSFLIKLAHVFVLSLFTFWDL